MPNNNWYKKLNENMHLPVTLAWQSSISKITIENQKQIIILTNIWTLFKSWTNINYYPNVTRKIHGNQHHIVYNSKQLWFDKINIQTKTKPKKQG